MTTTNKRCLNNPHATATPSSGLGKGRITGAHTVRLLVSVRSADEAQAALAGGADIIDVKEPARGALGMADVSVINDVVQTSGDRATVTAALGELVDLVRCAPPPGPLASQLDMIKIGLADAPRDWQSQLLARFKSLRQHAPIAVAYADHHRVAAPPVADVVEFAIEHRLKGVLIDTAIKDGCGLYDWLNDDDLHDLVTAVRAAGRLIALAGSLTCVDFGRTLSLGPDIVAVRGAACVSNDRGGAVDAVCVGTLAQIVADFNVQRSVFAV